MVIKILGIGFFFGVAGWLAYLGVTEDPQMFGPAGLVFVFALLLLLGTTVFRKSIDTEEHADEAMNVIKEAAKRYFS